MSMKREKELGKRTKKMPELKEAKEEKLPQPREKLTLKVKELLLQ